MKCVCLVGTFTALAVSSATLRAQVRLQSPVRIDIPQPAAALDSLWLPRRELRLQVDSVRMKQRMIIIAGPARDCPMLVHKPDSGRAFSAMPVGDIKMPEQMPTTGGDCKNSLAIRP